MKAIVSTKYGPPHILELKEVEKPTPKANEVLVKIKATTVNDYDWSLVRGKPYIYRLLFGLTKPKNQIPGMELAGIAESVGKEVNSFMQGDAVFGDISNYGFGSFAQYICIDERSLIKKPDAMSFEEAAAIPHASLLALQGLRDIGNLQDNQKILINGAGGGVGSFALQLAKLQNCHVTGVDTGEKLERMKSIGFDEVIDYKKQDFTSNGIQFDLILDCKTTRGPIAHVRSLNPKGIYVTIGGNLLRIIQMLFLGKLIKLFTKKTLRMLGLKTNKGLEFIAGLHSDGKIKCVIDGPYALEDIPRLIQYFGEGKHTGKIVIKID